MGHGGVSFKEPAVLLESMCGGGSSSPPDQLKILQEASDCAHFEEGFGPPQEVSEKVCEGGVVGGCDNGFAGFDAASFSQEKAEPVVDVYEANAAGGFKEETGQVEVVGRAEQMSCTEIDSATVGLERHDPVEVLATVVSPGVNEGLFPHLDNGSGTEIDSREVVNAEKQVEENRISKDDAALTDVSGSDPSAVSGTVVGTEIPGIDLDDSTNACKGVDGTVVLEEKVGSIEGAYSSPLVLERASVDVANKDEYCQIGETNACTGELSCSMEKVALANTPKERRKPKASDLIVFTRRNPKRSASHSESDLNIDRLTRISNRSRKLKKEKETFDPTLLVRMIQDPNLTTKKRKPLSRRDKVTQWGKNDNLSEIIDQSLQFCKSKKEREAEEKKQKIALLEKMGGKSKMSSQFVADSRRLKQDRILDRDMDSTLTHEISSGDQTVQRVTNERDMADPGSSPDSVVYNPLSCEANPVELQQKKLTKAKKKKKKIKGESVKPNRRGGLQSVSGNANQGEGGLYWFQIDNKGRQISNGKTEDKGQNLSASGVTRKEMGNMPDPYNGVTIALLTEFSMNGTREPLSCEGYLAQLLPAAKPLAPVGPLSIPEASGSIPGPTQSVPVPSNSKYTPEQPVTVPELSRQHLPEHLQSISSSLRPLHMPTNQVAELEKTLQVDAQLAPAQCVSVSAKPASKPRLAWVCCDECGKWRCIPAELADVIDETNCRWTCKDNADKAFADCSIPQEKSNAEINAELELSDASGDEGRSLQGSKIGDVKHMKPLVGGMRRHSTKSAKKALGHAPYTPLKTNLFLHRHRRSQTIDEVMVCNCRPPKNGGMGCRSQCLNRMLSIECIKGMCPCGDLCSNQQFQRRNYAKLMSLRCGKKGFGLQLLEDVPAGRFLIEYVGEVLDMATYEARQKEYASRGQKHFYFMTLNGGEVIDACAKGNLGRFINHSCDPNCRTEKWIVNGEVCIGLFAVRDIKKGEELTFDYNYVRVVGAAAKKCFCGAANCRGYIGGDPSSTDLVVQEDSDEEDYFEPVTVKHQARKESIHGAAAVATLSDNTLKKHRQPNKSQEINGMSTPVVQRSDTVEVHKLVSEEHLVGCKPDSAVSQFASSLVNGPTDKALAVPANSQQAFGLLPQGIFSQSGTHPENSSQSQIRKKSMRHKTGGSPLNIAKPENSHGVCQPLDKDTSQSSSSSSIAVSSYGLLELHLSRVNSFVDFKMDNIDCLSQPPGFSLPINSSNECRENLLNPLFEGTNHQNNSWDACTDNRESDDVSTPVLPDHSMEEQVPVDMNTDNLWESSCVPTSSSDDYAPGSLSVPEHLNLPNEDTPSEEDAPRTPVHVTRFLSNRVHSRRSGYKLSSYSEPSASDVPTEHVDLYLKNPDEHGRSLSPPVGTSGTKNVSSGMTEEDSTIYEEVREMSHDTAARVFEGVEEKLNKLLDKGGSISRRKHATKGYLKLLIVTAAAGDTGTSQRLRDLSLILDALLKTSNNYVLMDIMKTNGLQMLHTILKQNRDDFNRIPVIRKLLKVLGHLAERGILTLEQMNQGPPRPGMESFRESIYKLTKHNDKQVHYHARSFFNKYMPKSMRVHDSFPHTCNPSTSKRKSRWDIPSDSHDQDPSFPSYNSQAQHVERPPKRPCSDNLEDDAPPGFEPEGPPPGFETNSPPGFESVSPPGFGSVIQPALGSGLDAAPVQVALGYRQETYRPGVSVSYGIPAMTAKNLGVFVPSGETVCWGIAPSIPFKPFPPLPRYPTIGSSNTGNNGPGFRNNRAQKHWYPNSKNQRRFSRPWNYNYPRNSNSQRSCKDWPKWPRESR